MHIVQRYRKTIGRDALAGLTGAVAGAPQAMGFALIAGVSPVYGLYTAIVSTIIGSFTTSSNFMTVGPTNALALVVGSAFVGLDDANRLQNLFVLTLLVGLFQFLFGFLRLGFVTRFVSNAVMTGFITGAGLLIILGQLGNLTGYSPQGGTILAKFVDWVQHISLTSPQTLAIGLLAIALIASMQRIPKLKSFGPLAALIVTTAAVLALGWQNVTVVSDMALIPVGLPGVFVPDITRSMDLLPVALAIAVLSLVQGAAITKTVPEKDGSSPEPSQDFIGQGLANIVGSFFQGMPSGGSLSRTAVNVSAGAQTRLSNLFAGIFVAVILLAFGPVIEQIALAALAGHLIVAALSLIKPESIRLVWRVSMSARLAMVATFAATLLLPLEYSIYVGVALSLLLYIYTSSQNLTIVQLVPTQNNHYRECPVCDQLPDDDIVIVSVHGNLYFAAVRSMERALPDPNTCHGTVVILRIRHNHYLGSTGVNFLVRYARMLQARGGKLILAGIGPDLQQQLERSGAVQQLGPANIFYANDVIFGATEEAVEYARAWLDEQKTKEPPPVEFPAAV